MTSIVVWDLDAKNRSGAKRISRARLKLEKAGKLRRLSGSAVLIWDDGDAEEFAYLVAMETNRMDKFAVITKRS